MRNFTLFLLWLLSACIDPYPIEAPESESMMSVEGHITNGPGPHTIKVSRTATYGSVFVDFIRPVTQAKVAVRENETGLITFLNEIRQGIYETPAGFRGKTGNTYSLKISTREGSEYTSFPSRLLEVPPLDSISYRSVFIPTLDRLNPRGGIQLIAHFKDPYDQQNFYYWSIKNPMATILTFPEFYRPPGSLPTDPYQPKECCKYCDLPGSNLLRALFLEDDTNFNGLNTSQIAGFIEDDGLRLTYKFRFDFEQMAISEETFRFLRLVNQQLTLTGSVFDPPPANIRGNMVNLNNPDETVLGHFFAAGVSTKSIQLLGSELELFVRQRGFLDDCRVLPNAIETLP